MNRLDLKAKARENIRKDKFSIILITLLAVAILGGTGGSLLSLPFGADWAEFLTVAPATTSESVGVEPTAKDEFDVHDFMDDDGNIDGKKYYGFGNEDEDHFVNPFADGNGGYDDYEDGYDLGTTTVTLGNVTLALAIFLISGALTAGLLYYHRKVWRGETGEVKDLFVKFDKDFPRITKMYLLQLLYVFLWSLLFIIPGIVMSIAYSQAYFLMLDDPELSATDALELSKKLMKGRKWEYFVLVLSFLGWFILSVVTFGIATLWVEPYFLQTITGYYDEIVLPAKLAMHVSAGDGSAPEDGIDFTPAEPKEAPKETVTDDGLHFTDVEPAAPEAETPAEPEATSGRIIPGK